MSVIDVCVDDIHTLLLPVQMKLTVDPTFNLCCLGSSIKTSIGLDGKAGVGNQERKMFLYFDQCVPKKGKLNKY